MSREVEQIKERIDLVEFIRGYVDLVPAGRNLKALCPFHQEKTPSFIVSPERGTWRCFGACSEGGDVFSFLMKYENLEFHEALKVLAERAGVPLQLVNPRQQKEFGILYDLHELAKDFYRAELAKNQKALGYLKERGLKDETVAEFELGFAPGGEALTLHLIQKGFEVADLERAGLAVKNKFGLYRDKFFGRIIFPIWNSMGKIVAFTGRVTPWQREGGDFDAPKYLNSPETPIFSKSKILYGFHRSKNEIARAKKLLVVEGQMDFLMAWQAGVKNTAAISGTALTPHHLEKLRRLADTVILCLDNDTAGLNAMERGLDIFGHFDFHVMVADLGYYGDPADAVKADPEFLPKAVSEAEPVFRFLFRSSFTPEKVRDIPERKRLVRRFAERLRAIKSPVEQIIWVEELARHANVPEAAVLSEIEKVKPTDGADAGLGQPAAPDREEPAPPLDQVSRVARRLFVLAFDDDNLISILEKNSDLLPEDYRRALADEAAKSDFSLEASFEKNRLSPEGAESEFQKLLIRLKSERLRLRQEELRIKIKSLSETEADLVPQAMSELYSVSKELDALR